MAGRTLEHALSELRAAGCTEAEALCILSQVAQGIAVSVVLVCVLLISRSNLAHIASSVIRDLPSGPQALECPLVAAGHQPTRDGAEDRRFWALRFLP